MSDVPAFSSASPVATRPSETTLARQLLADLDAIIAAEGHEVSARSRIKVGLGLDAWLLLGSFRVRQWLRRRHVPVLGRIIRSVEMAVFGAELSLDATIGTGVYIVHSHAVVVGGTTVLGDGVKLLGSNTFGNRQGFGQDYPTVGRDAVIGAGARILGAITLGDGARVGANSVVTGDVPAGVTVVGIPARAIGTPKG